MPPANAVSEPYNPDNLLDRLSDADALAHHYARLLDRERDLLARHLPISNGTVLSVGAGWHPGRHLFPAPDFQIVAVDSDAERVAAVQHSGVADRAFVGEAGALDELPDSSFDVVLYRLVLHHIAFQGPLAPVFAEAARLLRSGGALVAIEPNLWHPVGMALAAANSAGVGVVMHGTPDDIPLSPARLLAEARAAGLAPELYGVTYGWRRLPIPLQRALAPLDALGSRPRAALFSHTMMLIGRR